MGQSHGSYGCLERGLGEHTPEPPITKGLLLEVLVEEELGVLMGGPEKRNWASVKNH